MWRTRTGKDRSDKARPESSAGRRHFVHLLAACRATDAPAWRATHQSRQSTDRVNVISEALPYLQQFAGRTVVVKYGGAAMKDESLKAGVVADLVLLATVGLRPVLVHGGGPEINKWLERVGIEPNFLNGLRVTDDDTMSVVEMVLAGRVNKSIVSLINQAGGSAVGICGKDANLLRGRVLNPDLGRVGEVTKVDTALVKAIVNAGQIPVIATVAADEENGDSLNVNADTAAGAIAADLGAEKLILMTDVPGILRNPKDANTLIEQVDSNGIQALVSEGVVDGGMIPKTQCCVKCVGEGVSAAHIVDGRTPHSLLLELLTDQGRGTMITQ